MRRLEQAGRGGLYSLGTDATAEGRRRKRLQGVEEDTRWARQGRVCRVTYWQNDSRGEGVETTEEG